MVTVRCEGVANRKCIGSRNVSKSCDLNMLNIFVVTLPLAVFTYSVC